MCVHVRLSATVFNTLRMCVYTQDYRSLVRDLSTTLLFLIVFLKSNSEQLRAAGKRLVGQEGGGEGQRKCVLSRDDVSRDVSTLFSAVAEIFHCCFSSPVSSTYVSDQARENSTETKAKFLPKFYRNCSILHTHTHARTHARTHTHNTPQHFRRVFLIGTQWLGQNPILRSCIANLYPQREATGNTCNLLTSSLGLLLPILDQCMTCGDRDLVDHCTERLSEVLEPSLCTH